MTESLLAKLIEAGGIEAGRPRRAPPKKRHVTKRGAVLSKRDPMLPPVRGHRHAWGKNPPGEVLRYRGARLTTFRDGRGRVLRLLEHMQTMPGLWWGRADLRDALAGRQWDYNSIKAVLRKAERRGLIEARATGEELPRVVWRMTGRRGRATKVYRVTRAGRWLIEMCG